MSETLVAHNDAGPSAVTEKKYKLYIADIVPFLGLAIILILFEVLTQGGLLGARNLINIFNNFFSIGLGAMSITFLMALGELDLSIGAIMGFSAAAASFASDENVALVLPVALIVGISVGTLNGVIISRLNVSSFICTIATMFIFRGLTTFLLDGTRSVPFSMHIYDNNQLKIIVFAILLIALCVLFGRAAFGKQCRAIGSAAESARQSGVRVERIRMASFMISGCVCGLLAFFSLVRTSTASSSTGNAFEFDVLLAVLFGGMTLSGGWSVKFMSAVIGSLSIAAMKSGMSLMGVNGLTQQLIQGILLIAIAYISFDRRNMQVVK
jgi:ribose transport system permease protein